MSIFKLGQIEVASKYLQQQIQINNMSKIDLNKVVLSDKVSCNNREGWQYIVAYQVDGKTVMSLSIKILKKIISYDTSQYSKNSTYTISLAPEWVLWYRNIWNKIELQLFEKLTT